MLAGCRHDSPELRRATASEWKTWNMVQTIMEPHVSFAWADQVFYLAVYRREGGGVEAGSAGRSVSLGVGSKPLAGEVG